MILQGLGELPAKISLEMTGLRWRGKMPMCISSDSIGGRYDFQLSAFFSAFHRPAVLGGLQSRYFQMDFSHDAGGTMNRQVRKNGTGNNFVKCLNIVIFEYSEV